MPSNSARSPAVAPEMGRFVLIRSLFHEIAPVKIVQPMRVENGNRPVPFIVVSVYKLILASICEKLVPH
jgi:hypothetical protein